MTYGSVAICYNEPRMIVPHLQHLPNWIDEKLVLVSTQPWFGESVANDKTAELAEPYARVIQAYWENEEDQRNTGQALHQDKDWVIVLDCDEFFDDENWARLKQFLETTEADAAIVEHQRVFYKDKEVYPCHDYQQLIAVRPNVSFAEKRIVATYSVVEAPVELLHFSWAKTDEEVWSKISHYAHANDFDIKDWYENVWLANKTTNLHPVTPEALPALIDPVLPEEIERLNLWPQQ